METDYYEQIEEYLKGTLSEGEKQSFEAEMEKDEDLRKTVKKFPLLKKVMQEYVREEAKSIVDEVVQKKGFRQKQQPRRIPLNVRRWAAIALFPILAALTYSNVKYPTDSILRAAHDTPTEMNFKSGQTLDQEWDDVIDLWDKNKKPEALNAAEQLVIRYPDNNLLKRNTAHLYFNEKEYEDAVNLFIQVSKDRRYAEDASFHGALSQVGLKNDIGKEILEGIASDPGHAYQKESQRVLEKLSSFWRRLVF
jgi:hypothetical protein